MSSNNPKIDFSDKFALASPKTQTLYPINERDWLRLKSMVGRVIPQTNWCQNISAACLGIFFTAILSLIGFLNADKVPNWILTVTWVILVGSFILFISCLIFDHTIKKRTTLSKEDIMEEIQNIENGFEKQQDESSAKNINNN